MCSCSHTQPSTLNLRQVLVHVGLICPHEATLASNNSLQRWETNIQTLVVLTNVILSISVFWQCVMWDRHRTSWLVVDTECEKHCLWVEHLVTNMTKQTFRDFWTYGLHYLYYLWYSLDNFLILFCCCLCIYYNAIWTIVVYLHQVNML